MIDQELNQIADKVMMRCRREHASFGPADSKTSIDSKHFILSALKTAFDMGEASRDPTEKVVRSFNPTDPKVEVRIPDDYLCKNIEIIARVRK